MPAPLTFEAAYGSVMPRQKLEDFEQISQDAKDGRAAKAMGQLQQARATRNDMSRRRPKRETETIDEREQRIRQMQAQLQNLRRENLAKRLRIIRRAFPTIFRDAEQFVTTATNAMPWDFAVAFLDPADPLAAIQEQYGIRPSRSRPHPEDVTAETGLFCEACELIAQWLAASRSVGSIGGN